MLPELDKLEQDHRLERGGEHPDTMPQAIRGTDAEGRSCIHVPVKVEGGWRTTSVTAPVKSLKLAHFQPTALPVYMGSRHSGLAHQLTQVVGLRACP